jgi:hypothetical protein
MADIDRDHLGGAMLQQAIGEAAGAGAKVQRSRSGDFEAEMVKGVFELVAAPAHIFFPADQLDDVRVFQLITRLSRGLSVDADLAGHDGPLGPGPGFAKTAIHERLIKARHAAAMKQETDGETRPEGADW